MSLDSLFLTSSALEDIVSILRYINVSLLLSQKTVRILAFRISYSAKFSFIFLYKKFRPLSAVLRKYWSLLQHYNMVCMLWNFQSIKCYINWDLGT